MSATARRPAALTPILCGAIAKGCDKRAPGGTQQQNLELATHPTHHNTKGTSNQTARHAAPSLLSEPDQTWGASQGPCIALLKLRARVPTLPTSCCCRRFSATSADESAVRPRAMPSLLHLCFG